MNRRRQTTIELVRHAEAQSRDGWRGRSDRERPLSAGGRRQAVALVDELGGPDRPTLYSSPSARCVQTLEPLAAALKVDVRTDEALAEATSVPVTDSGDAWVSSAWLGGRALGFLGRVAGEHAGGRVVACSHGDVLPAVLALLAGRDGLHLTDVACPKAGRFTLTFDGARCLGAVAVPAPDH